MGGRLIHIGDAYEYILWETYCRQMETYWETDRYIWETDEYNKERLLDTHGRHIEIYGR